MIDTGRAASSLANCHADARRGSIINLSSVAANYRTGSNVYSRQSCS